MTDTDKNAHNDSAMAVELTEEALDSASQNAIAAFDAAADLPALEAVSYTHLTLPTKRIV